MSKTIFDKNLIYSDNRYEAYRNYWNSIVTNGVGAVDLPFPQKGKMLWSSVAETPEMTAWEHP